MIPASALGMTSLPLAVNADVQLEAGTEEGETVPDMEVAGREEDSARDK